jgi:cyclic dehypoxanthinyl futalosine synthase
MGISREQALDCFRSDDLVGLGMEADAVRRRLHPEGVVSYALECSVRMPGNDSSSLHAISAQIAEAVDGGATGVWLAGPAGTLGHCDDVLRGLRKRFADLWIEALTAVELRQFALGCGLGLRDTLARLQDAGLDTIASDSEPLQDDVQAWAEVHRAAHQLGMRTTAAMRFGGGETLEQRMDFLETVRQLQQQTSGFAAFVPVSAEAPGGRELDGVTAVERLKTLAISRMFLDNVENVQSSWTEQGLKVLQTGLRFGANDLGALAPGVSDASEEDVRRIIRDAGFMPVQRDMGYRAMMLS